MEAVFRYLKEERVFGPLFLTGDEGSGATTLLRQCCEFLEHPVASESSGTQSYGRARSAPKIKVAVPRVCCSTPAVLHSTSTWLEKPPCSWVLAGAPGVELQTIPLQQLREKNWRKLPWLQHGARHVLVSGFLKLCTDTCSPYVALMRFMQLLFRRLQLGQFRGERAESVRRGFQKALSAASLKQPLTIIIDGLDRLQGYAARGQPANFAEWLRFLPLQLPSHVHVIVSVHACDSFDLLHSSKIYHDLQIIDLRLAAPPEEIVLGFEDVLSAWSARNSRRLSEKQRCIIREQWMASGSSSAVFRFLQVLEREQSQHRDSEMPLRQSRMPPLTLQMCFEQLVQVLSAQFGTAQTLFSLTILSVARVGVTSEEMVDLLSCNNNLPLEWCRAPWREEVNVLRFSEVVWERFRSIIDLAVSHSTVSDGELTKVLRWNHDVFYRVCFKRTSAEQRRNGHLALVEYFSGKWVHGKPFWEAPKGRIGCCGRIIERGVNPQDLWKGNELNTRKAQEFPFHLAHLKQWEELRLFVQQFTADLSNEDKKSYPGWAQDERNYLALLEEQSTLTIPRVNPSPAHLIEACRDASKVLLRELEVRRIEESVSRALRWIQATVPTAEESLVFGLFLDQARATLYQGFLFEAGGLLKQLLQFSSVTPQIEAEARLLLGTIFLHLGDTFLASDHLEQAYSTLGSSLDNAVHKYPILVAQGYASMPSLPSEAMGRFEQAYAILCDDRVVDVSSNGPIRGHIGSEIFRCCLACGVSEGAQTTWKQFQNIDNAAEFREVLGAARFRQHAGREHEAKENLRFVSVAGSQQLGLTHPVVGEALRSLLSFQAAEQVREYATRMTLTTLRISFAEAEVTVIGSLISSVIDMAIWISVRKDAKKVVAGILSDLVSSSVTLAFRRREISLAFIDSTVERLVEKACLCGAENQERKRKAALLRRDALEAAGLVLEIVLHGGLSAASIAATGFRASKSDSLMCAVQIFSALVTDTIHLHLINRSYCQDVVESFAANAVVLSDNVTSVIRGREFCDGLVERSLAIGARRDVIRPWIQELIWGIFNTSWDKIAFTLLAPFEQRAFWRRLERRKHGKIFCPGIVQELIDRAVPSLEQKRNEEERRTFLFGSYFQHRNRDDNNRGRNQKHLLSSFRNIQVQDSTQDYCEMIVLDLIRTCLQTAPQERSQPDSPHVTRVDHRRWRTRPLYDLVNAQITETVLELVHELVDWAWECIMFNHAGQPAYPRGGNVFHLKFGSKKKKKKSSHRRRRRIDHSPVDYHRILMEDAAQAIHERNQEWERLIKSELLALEGELQEARMPTSTDAWYTQPAKGEAMVLPHIAGRVPPLKRAEYLPEPITFPNILK